MEKKLIYLHSVGRKRRGWTRKSTSVRFYLLCCFFLMSSVVFGQEKKLSFNWTDRPLSEVLNTLEKSDVYKFVFNYEDLKSFKVTASVKERSVLQVLDEILKELPFTYSMDGIFVTIRRKASNTESRFTAKGKVLDEKKQPMPGVTVRLDSTMLGTSTAVDGTFSLPVPRKAGVLVFSFVGCDTKRVAFSSDKDLIVIMKEEASELDEVVVRAYGSQNKREMISSISTVKADEMKELPSASITSMLQGRLAGLNVIQQSGAPGSAPVVSVRGFNSLLVDGASDGQPLWVVDGIPMHSFVSPVTGTNTLADLDPSMIESVQVLKDAAAASIYGSRAGNGVILITTKKGKEGKTKFAANVSYTLSQLMEWPLQTGGRMERWLDLNKRRHEFEVYWDGPNNTFRVPISYEDIYKSKALYSGFYDGFWGNGRDRVPINYQLQDSLDPYYNSERNWWKQVFRTGKVLNANIQASGGTEKFQYMVGVGYYDEKGIMINSAYSRANLRSNLTAQLTDKLRMDTRIYLSYVDRTMNRSGNAGGYDGMEAAPDKQPTYMGGSKELEEEWLKAIREVRDRTDDYRAMASVFLEYEVLKGLTFSASGNLDYSQGNLNQFIPSTQDEKYHRNVSNGSVNRVLSISTEELLHYSKSFNEKHNFDLLLGVNASKEQNFYIGGSGMGGASDYVYYYDPFKNQSIVNLGKNGYDNWVSNTSYKSDFTEKIMVSYFGRLGYNYKQRYLVEATIRRDGSSTFGEGNRWANFPSVAAGWAFSEEPFIKGCTEGWLNWGKIRASYGTSGQTFTSAYLAYGLMTIDSWSYFMGNSSVRPDIPVSPGLTWEKTEQYDLGLDLDMFDYRLNVKLDYYYKYTSSLIYDVNLPGAIYIYSTQKDNAMEVSNEGIELEIQADILREGALSWRSKFNISRNWNRFEKSYSGKDINGLVIGRPLYEMKVSKDLGFYESEDDVPRYYKENGRQVFLGDVAASTGISGLVGFRKLADFDGDGSVDTYYAGSPLPVAYGGWVNEFQWKNFDLNLLLNFSLGRKMINQRISSLNKIGPKFIDYRDLNYWTEPGCNANLPKLGMNAVYSMDSNIEKVHSMSLKQITLGYNLPERLVNKAGIAGLRFFVTGENLFYLSNYSGENPEIVDVYSGTDSGTSYPLPRKWTLGLTLNF